MSFVYTYKEDVHFIRFTNDLADNFPNYKISRLGDYGLIVMREDKSAAKITIKKNKITLEETEGNRDARAIGITLGIFGGLLGSLIGSAIRSDTQGANNTEIVKEIGYFIIRRSQEPDETEEERRRRRQKLAIERRRKESKEELRKRGLE